MISENTRSTLLETARAILAGEIDVIEGSIRLARLAHDVVPNSVLDPDFVVFGALSSETDHLPTGSARQYWSPAALAAADVDIARITESAKPDVLRACQSIIERFENG